VASEQPSVVGGTSIPRERPAVEKHRENRIRDSRPPHQRRRR
jgi:hypothetical protein